MVCEPGTEREHEEEREEEGPEVVVLVPYCVVHPRIDLQVSFLLFFKSLHRTSFCSPNQDRAEI